MKLSFEELKSESSPPDFITKDKILEHVSQEEMFEKYSGETISNEQFCSRLRIDNKPGCNWKYSESGVLYHVDWAKGEWLDVFSYVMAMFNISFVDSIKQIGHDYGLINNNSIDRVPIVPKACESVLKESKEKAKISVELREWNKTDAKYWGQYNISSKTLEYFNIAPVRVAWISDRIWYMHTDYDPCYAYWFPDGLKLYRPINAFGDKWRNSSSLAQGWTQAIESKSKTLIITKSLKDVACLYEMGLTAIAPQSEGKLFNEDWMDILREKFDDIYVLFDNDLAGVAGAKKYRDIGCLPIIWERKYGKDTSDVVENMGFEFASNKLYEYLRKKLCQ